MLGPAIFPVKAEDVNFPTAGRKLGILELFLAPNSDEYDPRKQRGNYPQTITETSKLF